jgi:sugar phosphate isomerase/epimerase
VCEEKLDGERAHEQLALIGERGLEVCSVQPAVRTLFPSRMQPEPEGIGERLERFRRAIELIAPFAPGVPFVCNTGPPRDGNVEEVVETAVREYRPLADFAAGHGVKVALEPLSPALVNVESAIWTVGQAMRIIEAVDRESFGLCLDFWNVWQSAEVEEEISRAGERILCVHVSDWRMPRSFEDREVVGKGEIPLASLLRVVHDSGYREAYALEIFSRGVPDALWESDLREVIRESRSGLERAWAEAGL